ncbi:MAG: molybdopterin-binding/glycosyltransferase family 2 protein [Alphaproteobacteria bacterium]|nr:molybdopterin-binding/glycosyltransferase family 2 protein [Alphaproteobacteria bacterium]
MKYGPLPVSDALGALLVHGQTIGGHRYRKGHILNPDDLTRLAKFGVAEITVARFEHGDVDENTAARRLADAAIGRGVRAGIEGTGRVNIFSKSNGLVQLDTDAINRVNNINEAITIATLRPLDRVETDQVIATVKIIPFSVTEDNLAHAERTARDANALISLQPYRSRRVALIQTDLPGLKATLSKKTTEVIRNRVEAMGATLPSSTIIPHNIEAITTSINQAINNGAEMLLIVGASATVDRLDEIPVAIERAGGAIEHFGMPVDPGNLIVVAYIGAVPVLALPGSARSPRLGGNDLILERLMADIPIKSADIMTMGVGGLLKEIPSRPLPRTTAAPRHERANQSAPRYAAVILAGGQSRRMGAINKLLIEVDGKPMARHAIDAARAAGADPIIVVTGHAAEDVRNALGDDVIYTYNPDFDQGLSTSLRAGISAVPVTCDGAIVALADMPRITPAHITQIMRAHNPDEGHVICVPTWKKKYGNPVLWDRRFFDDMTTLGGDVGAKHLIGENTDLVIEVPIDDDAVLIDVDTPEALAVLAAIGMEVKT